MRDRGEVSVKRGTIPCPSSELDLGVTLNGGQSFRWVAHESGYRGVFDGCVWTLAQTETDLSYTVHGPLIVDKDYEKTLSEYFRLDVCLVDQCKKWAAADPHFEKSSSKVKGVRILEQDVVENVFSFICSSNNNILRISGMIEKLCLLFGEKICSLEGKDYYSFPSVESLTRLDTEVILKKEKFGYRAGYIANAAKHLLELGGKQWLLELHKSKDISYAEARQKLITLPGIGPKVADCICLMSLGHLEAIPVDTHIFQIAQANYLPQLEKQKTVTPKIHEQVSNHLRDLWGPLAGWAQAVVFCAKINNSTASQGQKRKNTRDNNRRVGSRKR